MAGDERDDNDPEERPGQTCGETAAERDLGREIPEEILALQPVYEALAHSRRRDLVYTLSENQERTLDELATKLAAWETDTSEAEIATLTHDGRYVSLYHVHVPKLVELDVIEFDAVTETITPGENAPQVLAVLEGAGGCLDSHQEAHARSAFDSDNDSE
ncbi:hypothetical protein DMJ13_20720 [halophilic archaeon]|nr:hypothetical protein DMJ13_20720 [halophilic archaeon]